MISHEILYLASPYTKGCAAKRLARFHAVTHVAAHLIGEKRIVFSPITMTHPIDIALSRDGETLGSEFWVKFDEAFMHFCVNISVLMLPGWEESSGVNREIEFFKERNVNPVYLDPREFGVSEDNPLFRNAF